MIESKEKRESKKYILIINFRRHFDWLAGYNMNWAVMAQRGIGGWGGGLENTRYLWLPQSRLIGLQSNFYLIFNDIWHVATCLRACIVSNIDRWFAQHDRSYLTHSLSIYWITESFVKAFAVWHKTVLAVLIGYIKMTKWTQINVSQFFQKLVKNKNSHIAAIGW